MRGPFLRVYVGVVLAVLSVQALSLTQMHREIEAEADRRVVAALAPGIQMMQRRLRRHRGPIPTGILEEVASHHGLEANVLRASDPDLDLSPQERASIDDEGLALIERGSDRYVYSQLRQESYLRLGPMTDLVPRRRLAGRVAQTAAVLMAIGGILFALLRPFERRLIRLAAAAREIGSGGYGARVNDSQDDAIGEVATAFDGMAARVEHTIGRQRDLLRAVSHELRTPIARLLFLTDELRDDEGSERESRLDRVDASLIEMRDLVNELLSFSRLSEDSGFTLSSHDVSALVADGVRSFDGLQSSVDIQTNLETVSAEVEPRLIGRALTNLLSNAVRHATSTVIASVSYDDTHAIITISDDGSGVPNSDRDRIFDPFVRLDESRQRDSGGAGLGLAIVSSIASSHGGSIHVFDAPNGGAEFVLKIPLSAAPR